MRSALFLCLLLAVSATPVSATANQFGIGGGYVDNEADVDDAGEVDGDGFFGVFRSVSDNGFLVLASLSITDADETDIVDIGFGPMSIKVETDFMRLGIGVGYMFRKDETVRPFLHGGLGWVQVEEDFNGIEDIDDNSIGFSVGVGLEAGKGHHAFYSDLVLDFGHEVEIEILGTSFGDSEFDLRELHLGYIYTY